MPFIALVDVSNHMRLCVLLRRAYVLMCWCPYSFLILGNSSRWVVEQTLFKSEVWTHPCGPPVHLALFSQLRDENGLLRAVMDVQSTLLTLWGEYPGSFHACRTGPGHPLPPRTEAGHTSAFWEELLLRTLPCRRSLTTLLSAPWSTSLPPPLLHGRHVWKKTW